MQPRSICFLQSQALDQDVDAHTHTLSRCSLAGVGVSTGVVADDGRTTGLSLALAHRERTLQCGGQAHEIEYTHEIYMKYSRGGWWGTRYDHNTNLAKMLIAVIQIHTPYASVVMAVKRRLDGRRVSLFTGGCDCRRVLVLVTARWLGIRHGVAHTTHIALQ